MHSTNSYSKCFTVAVENASSRNMNLAVMNGKSAISLIRI
jgi:hypothetical protein